MPEPQPPSFFRHCSPSPLAAHRPRPSRPSKMPDYNEGFAISPRCSAGRKEVVWSDGGNHALRAGTLPCGGN
jgi:hypothetical protein